MNIDIKTIKPRGKMLLVQKDEAQSRTSVHGISAPPNSEMEENSFGTVVAVGDAIADVKKGDRVIFGMYAGEKLIKDDKGKKVEYRLLEDEFVIAFIKTGK